METSASHQQPNLDHPEQDFQRLYDTLNSPLCRRLQAEWIQVADSAPSKKGGQGTVVLGTLIVPKEWPIPKHELRVAIKKHDWDKGDVAKTSRFFKSFVNEIKLTAALLHPNISLMIGFVEDISKGDAWIVSPWEPNGNVREFLQSGEWDIPERISLIQDVARGVDYLHSQVPPICHGDLKSLNILVSSEYRAVITDFGSARSRSVETQREKGQSRTSRYDRAIDDKLAQRIAALKAEFNAAKWEFTVTGPGFSIRWTAPEVLDDGVQDLPSDIWALGWICWEIVTGRLPFDDLSLEGAIISRTVNGQLPEIRENAQLAHILLLCNLMSDCWALEPIGRVDSSTFQNKVMMMPSMIPLAGLTDGEKTRSAFLLVELGRVASLQNDYGNAESHYRQALKVATRTGDTLARAHALNGLGEVYRAHAMNEETEKALLEAHGIYSGVNEDLGAGNVLNSLGRTYHAMSRNNEAEKAFLESHAIHSRLDNDVGQASALTGLGEVYRVQSRTAEAEKALLDAHAIHSRIGDDLGSANALNGLGRIYRIQSRNEDAEKVFLEAGAIHSRIGNDVGEATALSGLGGIYRAQSKSTEAEKAFVEAHAIHSRRGIALDAAHTLLELAILYITQERDAEAEEILIKAQSLYASIGQQAGAGHAFGCLGSLLSKQGRYIEAENSYREALKIYQSIDDRDGRARAILGLRTVYSAQQSNSTTENPINESASLSVGGGQPAVSAESEPINELQPSLRSEKNEAVPGPPEPQAGEPSNHMGNVVDDAVSAGILGDRYTKLGNYAEAEEHYQLAQAISLSCGDAGGEANALYSLGNLHLRQDQYEIAEERFAQARVAYAMAGNEEHEARSLDRLMGVLVKRGKFDALRPYCVDAREIYTRSGKPMSDICRTTWEILQLIGKPSVASLAPGAMRSDGAFRDLPDVNRTIKTNFDENHGVTPEQVEEVETSCPRSAEESRTTLPEVGPLASSSQNAGSLDNSAPSEPIQSCSIVQVLRNFLSYVKWIITSLRLINVFSP